MPARVYRVVLHNNTQATTLQRRAHKECNGEWTSDDWVPDFEIPPGGNGGFQIESEYPFQGCEAFAHYRCLTGVGENVQEGGTILLYGRNPYFGIANYAHLFFLNEAPNPCEESEYDLPPAEEVRGVMIDIRKLVVDGNPTDIDEFGDLYRVPFAPFWVFGAAGVFERIEVELDFTMPENVVPLAPPQGMKTKSLVRDPTPAMYAGHWVGQNLDTRIAHVGWRRFTVKIADTTPGLEPLDFEAECWLGPRGLAESLQPDIELALVRAGHTEDSIQSQVGRSVWSAAFKKFADTEPEPVVAQRLAWREPIDERLSPATVASAALAGAQEDDAPFAQDLAAAVAAVAPRADYALHPGHGVGLELWEEQEAGQARGWVLHYQRLGPVGEVLVDRFLAFDSGIR